MRNVARKASPLLEIKTDGKYTVLMLVSLNTFNEKSLRHYHIASLLIPHLVYPPMDVFSKR